MFNTSSIYDEKKSVVQKLPKYDPNNIRTYMYIKIGNQIPKQVIFELFSTFLPKTTANFKSLCTKEHNLTYIGTKFYKVIPGFIIQGGDIANRDGTGSISIYGKTFEDESFMFKHYGAGMLSMANAGKNTNGSQFLITFDETAELDGNNVVFGRVIKGMEVIREIEKVSIGINEAPIEDIIITDCGLYPEQVLSPEDIL